MGSSILSQSHIKYNKTIAWLTGILTLLLALFSFILSFNALADLAAQHHVSIPVLFPFVVEFAVVIFSLHALHRSLAGETAKVQWILIIGSSLLAGTFNVAHANSNILARTMAAMPSLFLLLSFESFLSLVRHTVSRGEIVQSIIQLNAELDAKRHELDATIDAKQEELGRLNTEADQLNVRIEQAQATLVQIRQEIKTASVQSSGIEHAKAIKAKQDAVVIEQRRKELTQILANEGDIGASAFATRLNISRGTVYRDLRALSETGQIVKDGSGWEVAK
jgi:hypothetical protein